MEEVAWKLWSHQLGEQCQDVNTSNSYASLCCHNYFWLYVRITTVSNYQSKLLRSQQHL